MGKYILESRNVNEMGANATKPREYD